MRPRLMVLMMLVMVVVTRPIMVIAGDRRTLSGLCSRLLHGGWRWRYGLTPIPSTAASTSRLHITSLVQVVGH